MRHTLGFADEPDFEIDEFAEPENDNDTPAAETPAAMGDTDHAYDDMREAIFGHVVAVFNEALPDFLARSVDPEAQRRVLYEKLDQGIKDYLARIGADADSRCEAKWASEQVNLRAEMETLKLKAEQIEHERAELKQRQLSADRQKRALSDRLKDLESQVGNLEAEREQYELENKSLLNKLKVVSVQHPELLENGIVADAAAAQGPTQEEYDAVVAENSRMREALQQAEDRQNMADEMNADLRKRLKAAMQDVDDLKAITEQVDMVQKAIAERDETITRQRDNILRLKEQIDTLASGSKAAEQRAAEREKELLSKISDLEQSRDEFEIRAASQAADEPEKYEESPAPKPRRRKPRRAAEVVEMEAPKITDDDLDDVEAGFADHDWFGVDDPIEAAHAVSAPADDDFGYHAPEPKPRPYDDGMQMSLFD